MQGKASTIFPDIYNRPTRSRTRHDLLQRSSSVIFRSSCCIHCSHYNCWGTCYCTHRRKNMDSSYCILHSRSFRHNNQCCTCILRMGTSMTYRCTYTLYPERCGYNLLKEKSVQGNQPFTFCVVTAATLRFTKQRQKTGL